MSDVVDYPVLAPGVCLVCEGSKHQRHIDTLRNIKGIVHPLAGRKYVCEDCVREFADKLGYTSPEATDALKHLVLVAQEEAAEAKTLVKAVYELKGPLEVLAAKLPDAKPAAVKKPRTTKKVTDDATDDTKTAEAV